MPRYVKPSATQETKDGSSIRYCVWRDVGWMGYKDNKAASRGVVKAERIEENVNLLASAVTIFFELLQSKRRASKQYEIETTSQKIGVKCQETSFLVIPMKLMN